MGYALDSAIRASHQIWARYRSYLPGFSRFGGWHLFSSALEDELGPQRFDLVLDDGTTAGGFADLARSRGVQLWSNS